MGISFKGATLKDAKDAFCRFLPAVTGMSEADIYHLPMVVRVKTPEGEEVFDWHFYADVEDGCIVFTPGSYYTGKPTVVHGKKNKQ